jgi:hypothetical protein
MHTLEVTEETKNNLENAMLRTGLSLDELLYLAVTSYVSENCIDGSVKRLPYESKARITKPA